ncbi:hypothetical protein N7453_000738 [Penicillium expansum]|nr:hypothetical protein N7453_000738 [Penicillium expansum]
MKNILSNGPWNIQEFNDSIQLRPIRRKRARRHKRLVSGVSGATPLSLKLREHGGTSTSILFNRFILISQTPTRTLHELERSQSFANTEGDQAVRSLARPFEKKRPSSALSSGLPLYPSAVCSVQNWAIPTTPSRLCNMG